MPSPDLLLAFFLATCVFAYMPDPSMLYAAARTIAGGRKAGGLAAIGLHMGGYVHVFAATFGLALIFTATPILYTALKFAGAAYLIWLGIDLLRADKTTAHPHMTPTTTRHFWESATVEILNPKTALFYLAFLPQFTESSASLAVWGQLLILGTIVNIIFSTGDILCVLAAEKITNTLKSSQTATAWAQKAGGIMLIALGVNLALSRQ